MPKLSNIITLYPHHSCLEAGEVGNNKWYGFDHADDEKIIRDCSPFKEEYFNWTWRAPALGAVAIFYLLITHKPEIHPHTGSAIIAIASLCLLTALFCFIYWKWGPDKQVMTINRLAGTVSLPGYCFGTDRIIPFQELTASLSSGRRGTFLSVTRTNPPWYSPFEHILLGMGDGSPEECWSFWLWYMDKNRPLPPGSAFHPYRQRDYERRKKAGFPPPHYAARLNGQEPLSRLLAVLQSVSAAKTAQAAASVAAEPGHPLVPPL